MFEILKRGHVNSLIVDLAIPRIVLGSLLQTGYCVLNSTIYIYHGIFSVTIHRINAKSNSPDGRSGYI